MFGTGAPVLKLTDAAAARVRELVSKGAKTEGEGIVGLRVSISNKGCSGMSYVVDYATEAKQFEEVVEEKGAKVFIDPAAVMFLIGAEMDYQTDKFSAGFTFSNPNETARCGCGESFSVA